MATYSSTRISNPVPAKTGVGVVSVHASVTTSAAVAAADLVKFFTVPAGATIIGGTFSSTDIDTNGTPTASLIVGDAGDTDRLFAATTIGQAGGITNDLAIAGHGYKYTADTDIYATVSAVATGAIGTFKLSLTYILGEVA